MLELKISPKEYYNDKTNEFVEFDGGTLKLEHSLYAVSEWESKWKKSFFSKDKKNKAEFLDYIRCMTLEPVDPLLYLSLTNKDYKKVAEYIDDKRSATYLSENVNRHGRAGDKVTSELVYYWMVESGIPFSCDRWNLNRLLTLIEIYNRKNAPKKKRPAGDILAEQAKINEARRKRLGTNG